MIRLGREHLESWEKICRRLADDYARRRAKCAPGSMDAVELAYAEVLWRLLAGLIAGILIGYVVHLALDAATPSGLGLA